jgi:YHS domain-containing protein
MRYFRYLTSLASYIAITFLLCVGVPGVAASDSQTSPIAAVNTTDGIALKGYDPVAYFTVGEPTPGMDQYNYRWKGAVYRFASAENLERFKADPEKYLPQYGGYCAYAMSIDRIADISPNRWAIVGDKLYLNNNLFSQTLWSVDKNGRIASADRNWATFPKIPEGK